MRIRSKLLLALLAAALVLLALGGWLVQGLRELSRPRRPRRAPARSAATA